MITMGLLSKSTRALVLVSSISFVLGQQQLRANSEKTALVPAGHGYPACCSILQTLQFATNLPVILMRTESNAMITREMRVNTSVCTCGAPGGLEYVGMASVRVRGSSSAVQNTKKSYSLDLRTTNGSKVDFPFMGFPSDDEWVLYGPEPDKTLGMRNFITYEMGRRMGHYASRSQYVELFLNQNGTTDFTQDHYWGAYLVGEKVKRHPQRVDISTLNVEEVDPSGGYILKYDNNNIDADEVTFPLTLSKLNMVLVYPDKNINMTSKAYLWIKEYMNKFEAELNQLANWRQFVDEHSFMDYFIATEVSKNPDGYRGSTYMYKDKGGALTAGPLWDYNEAFGMCCGYPIEGYQNGGRSTGRSGGSAISPEGWRFNICMDAARCRVDPTDGISQWYRQMFQDPAFVVPLVARYKELREDAISDAWWSSTLTGLKTVLMEAAIRNYERWSDVLVEPMYPSGREMFEGEMKELHDWGLARFKWLDTTMEQVGRQAAGLHMSKPVAAQQAPAQG